MGPADDKPTPSSAPPAAPAAPAPAAEPSTAKADAPAADATKTTDDAALPFDDELAALTPATPDPAEVSLADLSNPEAITKAINPDGQRSETEQFKNLQTLVGKHSGEVHKARQVADYFRPLFAHDATGQVTGLDPRKVMDVLGPDAVREYFAANNLKLVPSDFGPEQAGLAKEYPVELVEAFLPATDERYKDLSFDEKVEYLRGDADLLLNFKLEKRDRERQARDVSRNSGAVANQQMVGRLGDYAKADKGYAALAKRSAPDQLDSYLDRANAEVPESVVGPARADLVYKVAKLYRLSDPTVRKNLGDQIRKRVEQDLLQKRQLGVPVGGGGVHVGAGGGGQGAQANDAVWGD